MKHGHKHIHKLNDLKNLTRVGDTKFNKKVFFYKSMYKGMLRSIWIIYNHHISNLIMINHLNNKYFDKVI